MAARKRRPVQLPWNYEITDSSEIRKAHKTHRLALKYLFEQGVRVVNEFEFDKELDGYTKKRKRRRFRFDIWCPSYRVGLEIDGMSAPGMFSAHGTHAGRSRDDEKLALAIVEHDIVVFKTTTNAASQRAVLGYMMRYFRRIGG